MTILEEGYRIPVKMTKEERSTPYRERNNLSSRNEMAFVREEVRRLVKNRQVVEVDHRTTCVNPLSVDFKIKADVSIKRRLVIDLSRWVNKFIRPDKFRMARLQDALAQSSQGDYQSIFDISKAYHHLLFSPESYNLVGFCVTDGSGKERFYHFVVVVFGLGPAGQLLARVMRPILTSLMLRGIRNTMYVDDGRTVGATKSKADGGYALTLKMFVVAGFTVAAEKSDKVGDSSQEKEYLGFMIDTMSMMVHVPKLKLERILYHLTIFLKAKQYKVCDVTSMVGKLVALEPALGWSVLIGTRLAT
jgi:hypothetical protein